MELVDDFDILMHKVKLRPCNPIVAGYEQVIEELYTRIDELRRSTMHIGIEDLPNRVEMVLIKNTLRLKVWTGHLIVDKVFFNKRTYNIVDRLLFKNMSITVNGHGTEWNLYPRFGFHLLEVGLCLGDYTPPIVETWDHAEAVAEEIKKVLSGINCDSLGLVILPHEYQEWADIKTDTINFINTLLEQGKLKEVQQWI